MLRTIRKARHEESVPLLKGATNTLRPSSPGQVEPPERGQLLYFRHRKGGENVGDNEEINGYDVFEQEVISPAEPEPDPQRDEDGSDG